MDGKYVTGVAFAPREYARQKRDFAVRFGVGRQVIQHDQAITAGVAEVLGDRNGRIGGVNDVCGTLVGVSSHDDALRQNPKDA